MEITNRNIMLCEMSAELFELACQKGYDSEDFVNKLMNSEEGALLYSDNCIDMWLCANHVMKGIENEVDINKGNVMNRKVMSWIGYLYKCWSLTYPEETAKEILQQAPFEILQQMYLGLHVMSCEMAIEDLKAIYKEKHC